ncbi:hypothetical protein A9Q84_01060 [Halobacteriovorax marinus]|uniref:Lipoprotein n=1 Tax=Halobacteriovorax marinus TaxID=97084 RepID=A0A1Y5FBS5_9BACT|nr:hypothetical protein A9Q84_01060 [Halobacteriovorax marinus]
MIKLQGTEKMKINTIVLLLLTISFASCTKSSLTKRTPASDPDAHAISSTTNPKRSIQEVYAASPVEDMQQLSNARILIADYDLLRRDFPALQNLSNPQIDEWLLKNTAYISSPQAAQTVVNTPIPTTGATKKAYRPRRYNRANVFDVFDPSDEGRQVGIIDVKGTGSLVPAQRDHGNGVATLGESIREFIYERMMRDIVKDSGIPNKIVGSYAVIDPGFDVVHADGSTSPAGFYLRQGHDRWVSENSHQNEWLPRNATARIQEVFRRYGVDPNQNVQGTKDHHIFDFGHFVVRDDLAESDAAKKLPFNIWGYDKSIPEPGGDRWFYSKVDNPWNWSHALADSWRRGEANRHNVWQHFENLVNPASEAIKRAPAGGGNCYDRASRIINN